MPEIRRVCEMTQEWCTVGCRDGRPCTLRKHPNTLPVLPPAIGIPFGEPGKITEHDIPTHPDSDDDPDEQKL